jgi:hypothetical protein
MARKKQRETEKRTPNCSKSEITVQMIEAGSWALSVWRPDLSDSDLVVEIYRAMVAVRDRGPLHQDASVNDHVDVRS